LSDFENKKNVTKKEVIFSAGGLFFKGPFLKKICDVEGVINCCHGGVGENGDLSSFFEVNGIKVTSANSLSSHIAMDKNFCKQILRDIVPTIKGIEVTPKNFLEAVEQIKTEFSDSIIVKPNALGSSIGVKACTKENLTDQIKAIFELNDTALVEERVENIREFNQACYKKDENLVLSAIEEPKAKNHILTFADKYENSSKGKGTDRTIPAKISADLENQIIDYTQKIYSTLKMNGVARIDYIFDADTNQLYFNEINTIPGSMAFYLYEPVSIDYITLIEDLISNSADVKKFSYLDTGVLSKKLL
jgi:D-alanine-D-alanine ligase